MKNFVEQISIKFGSLYLIIQDEFGTIKLCCEASTPKYR